MNPPINFPSYSHFSHLPAAWQRFGIALSHVFSLMTYLPLILILLVDKIQKLTQKHFFFAPQSPLPSSISKPVSKQSPPSQIPDIVQQILNPPQDIIKTDDPSQNSEYLSSDSEIDESDEDIIEMEGDEKWLSETIAPEQSPEKPVAQPLSQVIDVPDDGNCLLYAFAVGLRKKYADHPEIQEKLQWEEVKSEQLCVDLFKQQPLLEAPGKRLREQAAKYLEENQFSDEIMLALIEGIASHIEVSRKKINEEEAVIPILMMDIEELKSQFQSSDIKKQLKQKQDQLSIVMQSVEFQGTHIPDEDDLAGYIEITKNDHVYCGIAQLVALSKEYNVPTRIIYNYDKDTSQHYEQILNAEANLGRTPPLPILTIVHVKGNHFQYLND